MAIDVSVVVCTLNEEKRIKTCLEYLRKQKFSGTFEIIVADGYSDDDTVKIAKPLADKVVLEKVRRISVERQAGAKVAKGKIVAFTDADTKAPTDWVQNIWNAFEKNPSAACVFGPISLHDVPESEQKLSKKIMPFFLRFLQGIGWASPVGSNMAAKRTAFEKCGGFNPKMVTCEDLDLARRIKKQGKIIFAEEMVMAVSGRRIKKWGYLYFVLFHLKNAVSFHLFNKASKEYEDVR